MCGLTGFWSAPGDSTLQLTERVCCMAQAIAHRGPDDSGEWVDPRAGVALGFRRLAILDLTPEGHQPMGSAGDRFILIFNGEVYNYQEIRRELEAAGHTFRGTSDTEVMLAAFVQWGITAAVQRFVGMFAFMVWDRQEQKMTLVRDRLGIKPMYYGWAGQTFMFGSELKALVAHPEFNPEVNLETLALYLRYDYIPAPHTIYQGIQQLPPGCLLEIASPFDRQAEPQPYWSLHQVVADGQENPFSGTEAEAIDAFDQLLRQAVRLRLISDVPLGAFLSGGIDSSTVVAMMQAQSDRPVRTFSIGFHESSFNEAHHASRVAQALGTDHTELYVSPNDALQVIPRLPEIYDEPFADRSQVPTYLLSQLTRRAVTVSLSGDGGDELLAGYRHYQRLAAHQARVGRIPRLLRQTMGAAATHLGSSAAARWIDGFAPVVRWTGRSELPSQKARRLGYTLRQDSPEMLYHRSVTHWEAPAELMSHPVHPHTMFTGARSFQEFPNFTHWMMYMDLLSYLTDDILTKVDRASMAVSLEARVPLLDHRVVEFAWRLPLHYKIRNGQGKWILRQVLSRYLPLQLVERPKQGFSLPIGAWLRGPLRDWGNSMLDEHKLRQDGYFEARQVRSLWNAHQAGDRDERGMLWTILMFQAWKERWIG